MMTRETDIIKGRITKYMAQSAAKTTVLVSQFNIIALIIIRPVMMIFFDEPNVMKPLKQ